MTSALGLPARDVMLAHPLLYQALAAPHLGPTPTSSADEVDLNQQDVIKSPLAKQDRVSQAVPSDSEDWGAAPAVDSQPPVDQAAAVVLPCCAPACGVAAAAPELPTASGRGAPAPWLMGLFNVALFEHHGCRCHPGTLRNGTLKRNENNQYCLDCSHISGAGMCKLCLPGHAAGCSGRVFQIRKYMYQTCVHVDDIQLLYDVSGVQAYCINSRRAVLIHPKNVEKDQKCPAFDHTCMGCHRPLRHDCTYCSLRCKVDVEFGLAPITPKGSAGGHAVVRDSGTAGTLAAAAAAATAVTQPRQAAAAASRPATTKRPAPLSAAAAMAGAAAAAAALAASSLDISHATRCSSGFDAGSSRSKRRKAVLPERSFIG